MTDDRGFRVSSNEPTGQDDVFDPVLNAGHPSWFDLPVIGEDGIGHHVEFTPGQGHRCLPDCEGEPPHAT